MKIKINDKNNALIQIAINKAEGNATAHTFNWTNQIIECARQAEAQLQSLGLAKGSRYGVIAAATSGGSVPNAYKYTRIISTAVLKRGSSAWFLIGVSTSETFRKQAGEVLVILTSAQDAEVTEKFRAQFGKQPVTVGGAA